MVRKMRFFINHHEFGFTLVELIIVMAILAVLAGIAVPNFIGILDRSKEKANAANINLIEEAVDLYIINEESSSPLTVGDIDDNHVLVTKGYLKKAPLDPVNNDFYMLKKNGAEIEVTSKGDDGNP